MFSTLMKHAKHFTKQDHENGAAKVVHLYEDGRLFMTDGVTAVVAHNVNPEKETYTLDINGSRSDADPYKNIFERFFPGNAETIARLNVAEMLAWTQALEAIDKYNTNSLTVGQLRMESRDGKLYAYYCGENATSQHEIADCKVEFERYFTIALLSKSMKLLKDLKYKECLLRARTNAGFTPIVLVPEDEAVQILILPCRSNWK